MKNISRREPLRAETIVSTAIAIADEKGVDSLSMRNLAERLGFGVMALYNHVANKHDLLGLMLDTVAAEIDLSDHGGPPLETVRLIAVSNRAMLVRHPWAASLWQQHMPGPARTDLMEQLLANLYGSGLTPDLAHHGFHAVSNHVVGYTLQELGMTLGIDDPEATARTYVESLSAEAFPHMIAHVQEHMEGRSGSSFELVLDLILDGLVRLDTDGGSAG